MSTSPTSKPASPDSPPAGAETDEQDEDDVRGDKPSPRRDVEVDLEVSRQRAISWTIGGIVFGILLIQHLGTVGVWAGFVLIAWGIFYAQFLVRSFVFPPGTIAVSEREVKLPRGLCRPGGALVVKPTDVTAVYLLRRSVPWNKAAPVLVVELGQRAMLFPRDWFASEADQRHVVHALLHYLRPASKAA
jgi:hypothetical protein